LRQIESERWGAAVVIAVTAGLRKGEVLALRWEDIEWKTAFPEFGEVAIGRQVQRLGRGIGLLVRDAVKTDASDAVRLLPPCALAALERRRKQQSAEILRAPKARAGDRPGDDRYHWQGDDIRPRKAGFIFTSDVGTVVDPRNFDRWFRAQCTKARMPKGYTFHRLRHDYASILLKQGVKDRVAQEMLRHTNYSTTANIYQHVSSDEHFARSRPG
jgi:integrase